MNQNYIHILKEFNISQKQGSSHHGIVRNLLGILIFTLGTSIIFLLNNIKKWHGVFSVKAVNIPHPLQRVGEVKWVVPVYKCSVSTQWNKVCLLQIGTDICCEHRFPNKTQRQLILWWWGKQRWWRKLEVWDGGSTVSSALYTWAFFGRLQYLYGKRNNNTKIMSYVSTTISILITFIYALTRVLFLNTLLFSLNVLQYVFCKFLRFWKN